MDKNYTTEYQSLSDEEVVKLVEKDDKNAMDYLINKYKPLVKSKSKAYFIAGGEKDDIFQEGMIGLYHAIQNYKDNKNSSFYSFAALCIERQIITAIKAAGRQKHKPLNSSVSLNNMINDEEGEGTFIEMLPNNVSPSPETIFIDKEDVTFIENNIQTSLSTLECKVLSLFLNGKSYNEIAKIVNKDEKAIDNALQRVRKKLEKVISEKNKCV